MNTANKPPSYLRGRTAAPNPSGPGRHLLGTSSSARFDIRDGLASKFTVQLPKEDDAGPPVVKVQPASGKGSSFHAYDSRKHPASVFADVDGEAETVPFACPECEGTAFRVAVGFEVPDDAESPDDTSWFHLALGCTGCEWSGVAWEHETA